MLCYLCLFWGLCKAASSCAVCLPEVGGNMLGCMEPLGRRIKDHAPSCAPANPSETRAVLPIAEPEEPCLGSLPLLLLLRAAAVAVGLPSEDFCRWWATYHLHF